MDQKKVLIVEDDKQYQREWAAALDGKVQLFQAFDLELAETMFLSVSETSQFDAVVMDACVPGDEITTLPLVRLIRRTFEGPMIAASSAYEFRVELMREGCDHESQKDDVPEKVLEVLGLLEEGA